MKTILQVLAFSISTALSTDEYFKVYLVDPRSVTHTDSTIATEWNDAKSDVMAVKNLSTAESIALLELLKTELTRSENVPFCGHAPAYVIHKMSGDQVLVKVSLCGLCSTWAKNGKLRVLGGKQSLNFLSTRLPIPKPFSEIESMLDLMKMPKDKSFKELK